LPRCLYRLYVGRTMPSPTGHEYVLWILTFAYAMHVFEEHAFDWRSWAEQTLKLAVRWDQFYVTNAGVIVLGIAAAGVGWRLPEFSLAFPALAIVNALLFHVLPSIRSRRYAPGLATAVVLFLPVGLWVYLGARFDGALSLRSLLVSIAGGIVLMAYPVVLVKIRSRIR
jgi:hypothetical protein